MGCLIADRQDKQTDRELCQLRAGYEHLEHSYGGGGEGTFWGEIQPWIAVGLVGCQCLLKSAVQECVQCYYSFQQRMGLNMYSPPIFAPTNNIAIFVSLNIPTNGIV